MGETLYSLELSSDDKKVIQQILSAHSPDVNIVVDVEFILNISKDISHRASPSSSLDWKKDCAVLVNNASGKTKAHASTIHKIGCELSCNCTGEGDLKKIILSVFDTLTKYDWDAKVVLALAAFTASYGEFCLLSQLHASSTLAKYVYILKPLPDISGREFLITELLKVVAEVSKWIIELTHLDTQYISRNAPPLYQAMNLVHTSVYWAAKGIAACSVQSIGLINVGPECAGSITEARKKLTELTQTLKVCSARLESELTICRKYIERIKENQFYRNLVKILLETSHTDSMEIFNAFFHTNEGELPLLDAANKKNVGLNVLNGKTVIFFFSCYDISEEEIKEIRDKVGKQPRKYEIVWIPIVEDMSDGIKQQILEKAKLMSWYSYHQAHDGAIKFIKKKWQFEKQPLLVVFNEKGEIVCQNAYHMLMTWESKAYPFNVERERTLWQETKWSLRFLVDEVDRKELVEDGKLVCFYGGDDGDWIKNFTSGFKEALKVEGLIFELIYVGENHTKTIINENSTIIEENSTIIKENKTIIKENSIIIKENWTIKYWDATKIKRFRTRLERIMYYRMQHGLTIKNDGALRDVMRLLGAEDSGQGWALIAHGSKKLVTMNPHLAMSWLDQFKKEEITIQNFFKIPAIEPPRKHCNHIVVLNANGINEKSMICVHCKGLMEKVIMYKCCVEE